MKAVRFTVASLFLFVLAACSQLSPTPGGPFDPLAAPSETYVYDTKWGTEGAGDGQLNSPYGIAIDSKDRVYVAESANDRVQVFGKNGQFIAKWGTSGSGNGQFAAPLGIALDSQDNVYVVDRYHYRIQKFTKDGVFITAWGTSGTGDGQFNGPAGIALDSQDNVYVVDTDNDRIQKFSKDGLYLGKWGSPGRDDGEFGSADGIAIDSQDNVYVSDSENSRIQKFTKDGDFITGWGGSGSSNGQFEDPEFLAVDTKDNVYVTDSGNDRIQKFTSNGNFITVWGTPGTSNGQFNYPIGIALDSQGRVYVADYGNDRIQTFRRFVRDDPDPEPATESYTINFESSPLNTLLYSVRVGQGIVYSGSGTAQTSTVPVVAKRRLNGTILGGQSAKVMNLYGSKRLTVSSSSGNVPATQGGRIKLSFTNFDPAGVTLTSLTLSNLTSSGAYLTFYYANGSSSRQNLGTTSAGGSLVVPLNIENLRAVDIFAPNAYAVDNITFEVPE